MAPVGSNSNMAPEDMDGTIPGDIDNAIPEDIGNTNHSSTPTQFRLITKDRGNTTHPSTPAQFNCHPIGRRHESETCDGAK